MEQMDRMFSLQNQVSSMRQNLDQISRLAGQMSQSERHNQMQLEHLAQSERNATQQLQQIQQMCNSLSNQLSSIDQFSATQAYSPAVSGISQQTSAAPGYFTGAAPTPVAGYSVPGIGSGTYQYPRNIPGIGTSDFTGFGTAATANLGASGMSTTTAFPGANLYGTTAAFYPAGLGAGTYQYPRFIPGIGTGDFTGWGVMGAAGSPSAYGMQAAAAFPGAGYYGTAATYSPAGIGTGTYQYPRQIPGIGTGDFGTASMGANYAAGAGASAFLPYSGFSPSGIGSADLSYTSGLASNIGLTHGLSGLGASGIGAATSGMSPMFMSAFRS